MTTATSTVQLPTPILTGRSIYERNYRKLCRVLGDEWPSSDAAFRLTAGAYMDLTVDRLYEEDGAFVIAMAQRYEVNGDLVPDPDMELRVFPEQKMVEALTFTDIWGRRVVYPEPGKPNLPAKKDLNEFLEHWLTNLIAQGHRRTESVPC